ncbi:hypothetical protein [Microbispora bryophytorum]
MSTAPSRTYAPGPATNAGDEGRPRAGVRAVEERAVPKDSVVGYVKVVGP